MEELDVDSGTEDNLCTVTVVKVNTAIYEPAGHVITGDLTIVRDA